jgi:hypothetical protein
MLLHGPEGQCRPDNEGIQYLPKPSAIDESTPDAHQEGEAEGLLRNTWRWMANGVSSAYSWWNPSYGEPEDPAAAIITNISHEPLGGEYTESSTPWEEIMLETGMRRDGLPHWGEVPMIARLKAEFVFQPPVKLRTTRPITTLLGGWMQENTLERIYSVSQPIPLLYLPRLVGSPFSSDSITDGHWPLVTAARKSIRKLRNKLAHHAVQNPTAQIGLTAMPIELDIRELIPELLRYMRTLPDEQAFTVDAMAAWWQYMDPLAVTLTAMLCPSPKGGSHYAQTNPDGLCGGHALYQALMRWRSRCNMHKESAATREIYKKLFADWRERLSNESNWQGLAAHDRETFINVLGAWICEFDSKDTGRPIQLSPTHWFPMSLVQLLGYDSGLRTWMMSDSTAGNNPAYNYVSSDGSDPSQKKCRLSSLNELARNYPASPLQHFGYSANPHTHTNGRAA